MPDTDVLPAPGQTSPSGRSDKDAWFHRALGVKLNTSAPPPSSGTSDAPPPAGAAPTSSLAPAGSDQQSQQFRAKLEQTLSAIDGNLAYTAEHAEPAKQQPMVAQREALVSAYALALKQIDPGNPAKAKPAIDKVLTVAQGVSGKVAQFRQVSEKAFNDWQSRQPKYDEAAQQIGEMQSWGHAKAPDMQAQLDAVHTLLEGRAYAQASPALDKFLPELKPAYDDYQKQKAAQQEYEPARQALDPRLNAATVSNFKTLEPMQQEFPPATQAMDQAASAKDFVKALEIEKDLEAKVTQYEQKLAELKQQQKEYEDAKSALQPKLDQALQGPPRKPLADMLQELQTEAPKMEESAEAEDFVAALNTAKDLGPKVDAYLDAEAKLEEQQKAYEAALAPLQPRITAAAQPTYKQLADKQSEIADLNTKMQGSANDEDYVAALNDATTLGPKLDDFEKSVQDLDAKKKQYEDGWNALQPKLQTVANPPHPKLKDDEKAITDGVAAAEDAAKNDDYDTALKTVGDLTGKADVYAQAVEELTQKKKDYDDAWGKLKPRFDQINQSSADPTFASMQQAMLSTKDEMEKAAAAEEYDDAMQLVQTLTRELDDYENADKEKVYVITYQGKKYYGTQQQLVAVRANITAAIIKGILPPIKTKGEGYEGYYKDLKALNDDQYIVAWVVTHVGGAHLEKVGEAVEAHKQKLAALEQAITGDVTKAEDAFHEAVNAIDESGKAIAEYMEALETGGERTITALEVTKVTCFAIAALCGGELIEAGFGVSELAAEVASNAAFSALEEAAKQGAQLADPQATHDLGEAAAKVGEAAFFGALASFLGSKGGEALKEQVAKQLEERLLVENPEVRAKIAEFVGKRIGKVIETLVKKSPDILKGKTTWSDLTKEIVEELVADPGAKAIVGKAK